jgi:hypothetical protein
MSDRPKLSPLPPDPRAIACMDCDGFGHRNGLPCFHCAGTGFVCQECFLPKLDIDVELRCECEE